MPARQARVRTVFAAPAAAIGEAEFRAAALAALLACALPADAAAQAPFWIDIDTEAAFTLQLDRIGRRAERATFTNLYGETEVAVDVTTSLGLGLVGVFKLEQRDFEPTGANLYFRNETAYVDQLYLRYTLRPIELAAGKIHPRFGFAWDKVRGLYGTDFGERYEIAEQLGGSADFSLGEVLGLPPAFGTNSLRIEAFHVDRSPLSAGAINRRYAVLDQVSGRTSWKARNRLAFGGPGNTASFSNIVASLQGEGLEPGIGAIDYTVGFSNRRPGDDALAGGAADDERGYVGGLAYSFRPVPWVTLTPLVEVVRLDNADGVSGQLRTLATAAIAAEWRIFTLSYAYQYQRDRGGGQDPARAVQHAAGLDIDLAEILPTRLLPDLTLGFGYRRLSEDGVSSNDFGTALTWAYRF